MNNRKTIKVCNTCKPSNKSLSRQKCRLSSNRTTVKELLQRNSLLKQQNVMLKQPFSKSQLPHDLYSRTSNHCDTGNCTLLQDKLFQANKALQLTITNLDAESECNRELELKLTAQEYQVKKLQHERNALLDEIDRYKIKLRKYMSLVRDGNNEGMGPRMRGAADTNQELFQKYNRLLEAHSNLQEKYEMLEEYASAQNLLEKASKKMSVIQRNITKIEENKEELIQTMALEFQTFQADVTQFIRGVSTEIRALIPHSQTMNTTPVQSTYKSPQFRQILQKYNVTNLVPELLNMATEFALKQLQIHQQAVDSAMRKLEAKFSRLHQKYTTILRIIATRPKSKPRRLSQYNNENINNSNRLQHSFY